MSLNLRRVVYLGGAVLLLFSRQPARAGGNTEETNSVQAPWFENAFEAGRFEAALTSGVLFSFSGPSRGRPPINYTFNSLQLGYMLNDVNGDSWRRGNLELVGEGFGSAIFEGEGSYISGGTLWLRYNFVPRSSFGLVPYAQAGGGFVSTDIDHGIVGQPFNFNLDLAVGVRYFVGQSWSLNLEYRYQHISNAGLNQHNLGINADGPILGVSYFF
jgi:lipid A 3-O-deacylase